MTYTYAPLETPVLTPDEGTQANPLPIVFPEGYNPEASRNIPPRWRFLQNLLLEKGVSVAASTLVVQQLARAESLNKIRLPKFQLHVVTNLEEMSRLLALQLPSSFQTVNPLILDEC